MKLCYITVDGSKSLRIREAEKQIDKAIDIYNNIRLHSSCEMLTPMEAHRKGSGPLKKLWRQRKAVKSNNKDESP